MKSIIITLCVLAFSCKITKQVSNSDTIIGRWRSESRAADYPHLTFRKDGFVFFDCKIDTFFGLRYAIEKKSIVFMPINGPVNKSKILKLTQDSLILETLLELQTKQIYYRYEN